MVSYFRTKDRRIRILSANVELPSVRLRFFLRSNALPTLMRQKLYLTASGKIRRLSKFSMRSRNRCLLTVRSGSVFRHFKLSRIIIKEMASRGLLAGMRKSSW